jgi:hypothetical protein
MNTRDTERHHESRQRIWLMIVPPVIWAVHFTASYITVALWCAKVAGRDGALDGARSAIAIYTVVAIGGIAASGWRGYQKHMFGGTAGTHDFDSPEDRHRFLGFAVFLLAGLSAAATIFSALAVAFFEDCR